MCERTDRVRYPLQKAQVPKARHRVIRVAREWGMDEQVVDAVAVVVSELMGNAVTHARSPRGREVEVTLRLFEQTVRVEVRDANDAPPMVAWQSAEQLAETGRGLALVAALARAWGHRREVIGKTVWADCAQRNASSLLPG